MMVLDHVGDQEAMVYAQLGQQMSLARTTETSLEPRLGTLSGLSARPPDLAFWTGTRPPGWWACPRALFHFYTPSARRRRDPRVRVIEKRTFCRRFMCCTSRGTTPERIRRTGWAAPVAAWARAHRHGHGHAKSGEYDGVNAIL